MSNEQLFFGLSQALRKFPKETGKPIDRNSEGKRKKKCLCEHEK